MILATAILLAVAAVLMTIAHRRGRGEDRAAINYAVESAWENIPRVVLAILAAGFLSILLPRDHIAAFLGEGTGIAGVLLASILGLMIPGGPMLAFPIALALLRADAGFPQVIALLTAWSIFTILRVMTWEAPIIGMPFLALRIAASLTLPLVAAAIATVVTPF